MITKKSTELLSPAGSPEALRAAVQNGADAVYIGEKTMSARQNARNFTWEEIREAAGYCHVRGVRLFLALNTLMRPGEENEVENAVRLAAENGIDALIIQDLGTAEIARRVCPSLERHASTQLCAHSVSDVRELKRLGFSRVVLSRELSKAEIEKIHGETDCELEAFVHGALCVCFSGRCLMSSFIGGRSGNRGSCAQPCRKLYFAEGKRGYFLSPRDLCLAKRIDEMRRVGIFSFKIEGRMKSPEYVAVVTGVYRRLLDGKPLSEKDETDLKNIFSRGGAFTEAYFSGINTPEMMNYRVSNDNISASAPHELISRARASFSEGTEHRCVGLEMKFSAEAGKNMRLEVFDGENSVAAVGSVPETAENAALTAESVRARLSKTGGTPYVVKEFSASVGEGLFASAGELNALRRDCVEKLNALRGTIKPLPTRKLELEFPRPKTRHQKIYASIISPDLIGAAGSADRIIIPLDWADRAGFSEKYLYSLPQIILNEGDIRRRLASLPKGTEVYSSTLGGLALIKEAGLLPRGDFGLNVSNAVCAGVLSAFAEALTLSPELSLKEIREISSKTVLPTEIVAYGRQMLMLSRACIIRGARGRCDCAKPLFLSDKTGARFPVFGDRKTHINTVYNSCPTFMADKLADLHRSGAAVLRLCFTTETADEVKEIIKMYKNGGKLDGRFTRGYFFARDAQKNSKPDY